ncbi:MAG: hypothetical protein LBG19_02570 [Prevotellaceae bacterium]|jgi:hypothetical protein|nr:hypothetical protein [Prevotellaceae bacterium]
MKKLNLKENSILSAKDKKELLGGCPVALECAVGYYACGYCGLGCCWSGDDL